MNNKIVITISIIGTIFFIFLNVIIIHNILKTNQSPDGYFNILNESELPNVEWGYYASNPNLINQTNFTIKMKKDFCKEVSCEEDYICYECEVSE